MCIDEEGVGKMVRKAHTFRGNPARVSLLAGLATLLALATLAGMALAQNPQPPSDDQVNAIARELYCPICENVTLDVCPTQACAQWRELIRIKLTEGWSEDQIRDYFADQYGDGVLSSPTLRGFNWVFYALLVVFFGVAVVLFLRVVLKLKTPARPAGALPETEADASQDEYQRQLEEELRRRERGD